MAVDLRKVKKLIELVEEHGIAELEVASGDESVRIAMVGATAVTPMAVSTPAVAPAAAPAPLAEASPAVLPAPMAGTFYRAPHPDAAVFVEEGQQVDVGDVVCIIESMKMMHEIRATIAGTVAQICVANGTPVATGEALFKLS